MTWKPEVEELRRRRKLAEQMGGAEKVARQHARGKLDARARIKGLVDAGSFREIGKIAGKGSYNKNGELLDLAPSNLVFGRANIEGRPVVASADDFTVRGGAADAAIHRKFVQCEQMASTLKIPLIRMIDGTGGGGSVRTLEDIGATYVPATPGWGEIVKNLETVPVVALALGPTAGLGAARVVASHYSIMVKGLSQVFAAGPAVVEAIGEASDKESLGGSAIHTRNGVVDEEVGSEAEAFAQARRFLSYLPSYVGQHAPRTANTDPTERKEPGLISLVPREAKQVYSMRKLLDAAFDKGSVFEMGKQWGRAAITAFARLDGWPVAVVASDPTFLGGSWEAKTSEKGGTLHQTGRPVPPAGGPSGRQPRLHDRPRRRNHRHNPLRRQRDERDLQGDRAAVLRGDPPRLWHRGQRDEQCRGIPVPLRLAQRRLGQPADRRRDRGGLQERDRGRRGRPGAPGSDPRAAQPGPQPIPHGGEIRDRGYYRSTRNAAIVV
jgi:acetyl-CoA carboxylase carboxyltransferase component